MAAEDFGEAGNRRAELSPFPLGEQTVPVHKAPVEDGSFLVAQTCIESRFTFDYLLSRRQPFIRFPRYRDVIAEPGLPLQEFWVADLRKDKIPTPVDERGLIDYDALIEAVNATIDPEYQWPMQLSLDHFYWPGTWYDHDPVASRFRQLSIHKGIVPREWENWKHEITIPPALPSREVMEYRIEAWNVASSLFKSITETERWRRRAEHRQMEASDSQSSLRKSNPDLTSLDPAGRLFMRQKLAKYFSAVEEKLKVLERIPEEFRLIHPGEAQDIMAEQLMRAVGSEALYLVNRVAA